eukprot:TRINITY_DN29543_c0_g1_i1.p1 TRINITY_DN29543_c0_g1~~TRINITY_DN29543_c0_g1_i1.p1  ORF type:complete len:336 (+),score=79.09 TRINITY_DN29543_c0_g1_i1:39-1046(+)
MLKYVICPYPTIRPAQVVRGFCAKMAHHKSMRQLGIWEATLFIAVTNFLKEREELVRMDLDKARSDIFHLLDATEDDLYHKSMLELLELCEVWCAFREVVLEQLKTMDPKKIEELHQAGVHVQLEHFVGVCLTKSLVEESQKLIADNKQSADKKIKELEDKLEVELPKYYKEAMRLCKGTKFFPPFQGENMGGCILNIEEIGLLSELSPSYCQKWEAIKDEFAEEGGQETLQISQISNSCVLVLWPHHEDVEEEEEEVEEKEQQQEAQKEEVEQKPPQNGEKSGIVSEQTDLDPNWHLQLLDLNDQDFEDMGSFKYLLVNSLVNSVEVGLVPEAE